ncbi:MAG TPA: FAD-dependent monooxygenase [Pyrinomonadaceae bacterium]|nr:FAD-dependent monooxygenase [Pyrinomonadaceae bacterium]
MEANLKTDVLIVGAGPTGLALACQLIRYGVSFVMIDTKETTTPYSKAIGVQARTLEIYEQIGLAEPLVNLGQITKQVRLLEGGKARAEVQLGKLGEGRSPYPYLLIAEQGKHEALLHQFIRAHGHDVRWQTTLENFSHSETSVIANIRTNDETQTIEAKYLVACDGARSSVRTALGLEFEGSTFERLFYVADVQISWEFPHDMLTACLAKDRSTAFFPMPGKDRYRIVGVFPDDTDKKEGEIPYEEVEQQIRVDTELELDIYKVNWFSTYRVHSRKVNKFSKGRCFLAGDSAHIHSPAGAQGMNTGIQDGYNLAWKLALVLRGHADPELLATYDEERSANAKRLLETTDRMFDLLMNPAWLLSFVRTQIFPHVANFVVGLDTVNQFIFPLISQIGINYRNRTLSLDTDDFDVRAGDRMPYFLIGGKSIYDWLHQPSFHLLTFADERGDDQRIRNEIEREFSGLVDYHSFPLDPRAAEIFGTDKSFSVLLRPDNYIGFVSTEASPESCLSKLRAYFADVIGRLQHQPYIGSATVKGVGLSN